MSFRKSAVSVVLAASLLSTQKADALFGVMDSCWNPIDNFLSWNWETTLDVTGGYRNDRLTCVIDAFDPPGTLISIDDLKATNLSVWEWGAKSRVRLGDFYVKAWGTFGIITDGRYTETGSAPNQASIVSKAHISQGKTEDASFGLGYLFCVGDYLSLSPVGGWSYNYQRVKLKHAKTEGIADPTLDGVTYRNRWQGPWAGFEATTCLGCITINLGYEYHWAHWHAEWKLNNTDILGLSFSDRRKANNASGNVVSLNSFWNIWEDFDAGILFKYQYWRAKNGRETPIAGSFADVGLGADEVDKIPRAIWQSYEIQLSLGYTF